MEGQFHVAVDAQIRVVRLYIAEGILEQLFDCRLCVPELASPEPEPVGGAEEHDCRL